MIHKSLQPQVRIMFIRIKARVKRWQSSIRLIRWQSGLSSCFPFPVGRSQLRNYCSHCIDSPFTTNPKNWTKLFFLDLIPGFCVPTCICILQLLRECIIQSQKKQQPPFFRTATFPITGGFCQQISDGLQQYSQQGDSAIFSVLVQQKRDSGELQCLPH